MPRCLQEEVAPRCSEMENLPSIRRQAGRHPTEASWEVFKGLANLSTCYDTNVLSVFLLGRHYPTPLQIDELRGRSHIANTFVSKHITFQFSWSMSLPNVDYRNHMKRQSVTREIWLSFICGIPHLSQTPTTHPQTNIESRWFLCWHIYASMNTDDVNTFTSSTVDNERKEFWKKSVCKLKFEKGSFF